LVTAFETALQKKREQRRLMTVEEMTVLAIQALEREVNNGGFDQFFFNSSHEFAPTIVEALSRIGCTETAKIVQEALWAVPLASSGIAAGEYRNSKEVPGHVKQKLSQCDNAYWKSPSGECVGDRLFEYIKGNKFRISF
jgi:hypothetical protein